MRFTPILLSLALLTITTPVLSTPTPATVKVTYDPVYDKKTTSLSSVACSNGKHGLLTKGYKTLGALKAFPMLGGASAVSGWNDPDCGSCWEITYKNKTITVLAVDHCDDGFNLSEAALNKLTNGKAVEKGYVKATAKKVDAKQCGL
ncbi:immunomodulatory protein [Abortiporus biennis]|nr:immunomodulatory protein [Abortiporus biennis]